MHTQSISVVNCVNRTIRIPRIKILKSLFGLPHAIQGIRIKRQQLGICALLRALLITSVTVIKSLNNRNHSATQITTKYVMT